MGFFSPLPSGARYDDENFHCFVLHQTFVCLHTVDKTYGLCCLSSLEKYVCERHKAEEQITGIP